MTFVTLDTGSNSYMLDVPPPTNNHYKLESRENYHKWLVNESGDPLYPSNYGILSSNHYPR